MPCKWRQPRFHLFSIKEIESRHFIQELNYIILRHKTAGKRLDIVGTYLNKFAELFLAARLKKAMDWCWSFAVFFSLSVNQKANLVRLGVWTNFTLEFFADFNFLSYGRVCQSQGSILKWYHKLICIAVLRVNCSLSLCPRYLRIKPNLLLARSLNKELQVCWVLGQMKKRRKVYLRLCEDFSGQREASLLATMLSPKSSLKQSIEIRKGITLCTNYICVCT